MMVTTVTTVAYVMFSVIEFVVRVYPTNMGGVMNKLVHK